MRPGMQTTSETAARREAPQRGLSISLLLYRHRNVLSILLAEDSDHASYMLIIKGRLPGCWT